MINKNMAKERNVTELSRFILSVWDVNGIWSDHFFEQPNQNVVADFEKALRKAESLHEAGFQEFLDLSLDDNLVDEYNFANERIAFYKKLMSHIYECDALLTSYERSGSYESRDRASQFIDTVLRDFEDVKGYLDTFIMCSTEHIVFDYNDCKFQIESTTGIKRTFAPDVIKLMDLRPLVKAGMVFIKKNLVLLESNYHLDTVPSCGL